MTSDLHDHQSSWTEVVGVTYRLLSPRVQTMNHSTTVMSKSVTIVMTL